ncbi:MurR/RpiR family transcriptional regulator [Mollicutes bacterium LVI A0039]|nr:MurR/RpiR family transcriptional regulator [Mollicutes bacterium LVI A0039]
MDFFERTGSRIDTLTKNELKIYNYILDNLESMHSKTVRAMAKECYVSTSTILRLVRKLGFEGYNEMIIIIKYTLNLETVSTTTITEKKVKYKEEYAKNILESIRVLDDRQLIEVTEHIKAADNLYIFSRGLIKSYGSYIEFLFELNGVDTYFASNSYYRRFYASRIQENDFVIVIDYHGDDQELINIITKSKSNNCKNILTITQANNNIMQNLSNYNLYYFSDDTVKNGFDITSNVSVMAILELIIHNL